MSQHGILTPEGHQARHIALHKALDELLADYLDHNRKAFPSTTTVLDLMYWSNKQQVGCPCPACTRQGDG